MNSIPLIFNEKQIRRTILGGTQNESNVKIDISIIMINKNGSQFRIQALENLLNCGFKSIVFVEPDSDSFNIEDISYRFPSVKFILPLEETSDGDLINIAVSEIDSEYFLVLRDCLHIPSGILLPNLAKKLIEGKPYCIVPRLLTKEKEAISLHVIPQAYKGRFVMENISSVLDGVSTVYPFDYIGLYNREKFISLGGFDYTITNPYWQNADLSLRAWLWGEKIKITTSFQLSYTEDYPIIDTTPDITYLRFYLKNILPKFKNNFGYIKAISFLLFLNNSSLGFLESLKQFLDAKKWVEKNKYRFTCDVQSLIENWVNDK